VLSPDQFSGDSTNGTLIIMAGTVARRSGPARLHRRFAVLDSGARPSQDAGSVEDRACPFRIGAPFDMGIRIDRVVILRGYFARGGLPAAPVQQRTLTIARVACLSTRKARQRSASRKEITGPVVLTAGSSGDALIQCVGKNGNTER
jgi:hypothetical protein